MFNNGWGTIFLLNREDTGKNIFISPLSISGALAMTLNGAEGSTREVMAKALEYHDMTKDEINKGYKYLLNRLENLDENIKLNISNSIWIRDGFNIKQSFIDLNFTTEIWYNLIENLAPTHDVVVQIPKFKMEYGIKELNTSLASIGMGEAFVPGADFSGIADDVTIDKVLHKAVIEINEEGSEAAAATVVEMRLTAVMEPVSF